MSHHELRGGGGSRESGDGTANATSQLRNHRSLPGRAGAGAERGLQCTTATAHARRPLPAPGAGPGTLAPLATVAPQPDVRFALGARGAGNGSGSQVLSDGCNETEFDARCAVSPTPSLSSCPGPGYFGALVRERCR